jgi:large subunit ribosomal protein L23
MHIYEVLRRPVTTEKSSRQSDELNQYTFEVDKRANKQLVKEAVETAFDVKVVNVRMVTVPAKKRRYGRRTVVSEPLRKKAIVTLAEGNRIQFFEGV